METPGDALGSSAQGLRHLGYQGTGVSDGPACPKLGGNLGGGAWRREFAGSAIVASGEVKEGRESPSRDLSEALGWRWAQRDLPLHLI